MPGSELSGGTGEGWYVPEADLVAPSCQLWWTFAYVMHLHENVHINRAGVARIRARATSINLDD